MRPRDTSIDGVDGYRFIWRAFRLVALFREPRLLTEQYRAEQHTGRAIDHFTRDSRSDTESARRAVRNITVSRINRRNRRLLLFLALTSFKCSLYIQIARHLFSTTLLFSRDGASLISFFYPVFHFNPVS